MWAPFCDFCGDRITNTRSVSRTIFGLFSAPWRHAAREEKIPASRTRGHMAGTLSPKTRDKHIECGSSWFWARAVLVSQGLRVAPKRAEKRPPYGFVTGFSETGRLQACPVGHGEPSRLQQDKRGQERTKKNPPRLLARPLLPSPPFGRVGEPRNQTKTPHMVPVDPPTDRCSAENKSHPPDQETKKPTRSAGPGFAGSVWLASQITERNCLTRARLCETVCAMDVNCTAQERLSLDRKGNLCAVVNPRAFAGKFRRGVPVVSSSGYRAFSRKGCSGGVQFTSARLRELRESETRIRFGGASHKPTAAGQELRRRLVLEACSRAIGVSHPIEVFSDGPYGLTLDGGPV
ncbi:hypothetical protein LCGC14_2779790 [marine sediment metagenome]|uniref:Uncharacterized protein n=1 Tax=marine sediment metagenome TaxID=412755 RepID=A0A0F9BK55_9ZZZZ